MKYPTIRFKWSNNITNKTEPFLGDYITVLSRVPNIGEHISFNGHPTPYKVVDIISEIRGWDDYYTIVIE